MDDAGVTDEVDEILQSLHDGLKKAEEVMSSILEGMVSESAHLLNELDAALSDVEAALLND